jgi:hypothetical protein
MTTPSQQVSKDALRALEEFSDEFKSALTLAPVETWAESTGLVRKTDVLKTTFPIPLDAAGYKELKGDMKFRSLYHRSLSMISKEWYDGVEEKAQIIEAPDFIDWAGAPGRMALEWTRHPNILVATMLAVSSFDGPYLDFYRDADSDTPNTTYRLFNDAHLCNVLDSSAGTFDNTLDTTVADIQSGKIFDDLSDRFALVNGPNGMPLGLDVGQILIPQARKTLFKNTLEFDTLIRAVSNTGGINTGSSIVAAVPQNNVYKGIKWQVGRELTSANYFYALCDKPELYPWAVQVSQTPEEILHDKSSELYRRQRKVGVAYIGQANVAPALPHGVIRCHITG